jgi:hypothetical protein
MGDMEEHGGAPGRSERLTQVEEDLARASIADDEVRLAALENLYGTLERDLEGDLDQAGATRH